MFFYIFDAQYPYQIVDFGCRSIGVAKIARWKRSSEVGKGDLGVMIIDHGNLVHWQNIQLSICRLSKDVLICCQIALT